MEKIRMIALPFTLLALLLGASASASVGVYGTAPRSEEPGLEAKLNRIWTYEKEKYLPGKTVKDPEIYFFPFDRARESAEFAAWQNGWVLDNPGIWQDWTKIEGNSAPAVVTKEWVQQHPDLFPFPKTFLAFHYDGTNRIQINPEPTFLAFYQNDPFGTKSDNVGFGYYTAAHELLHYSLAQAGIPDRLHHCLFVSARPGKPKLNEDLAQFLVDQKISSSYVMFMGARKEEEFSPCEQLTAAEKAQVKALLEKLP